MTDAPSAPVEALLRAAFPTWDAAEAWLDGWRPYASGRSYRGRSDGTISARAGGVIASLWVRWPLPSRVCHPNGDQIGIRQEQRPRR